MLAQAEIGDCVVDFLNLIFGKGIETDLFWNEILARQVDYDFNFKLDRLSRQDFTPGALVHAIAYHCSINLAIDEKFASRLGSSPKPFSVSNYKGLKAHSRIFTLANLDIKTLCDKYQEYREKKSYDLCIKACNVKLSMEKALSENGEVRDPKIYADVAEIYFEMGMVDQCIDQAHNSLRYCRNLHAECVRPYCILMRAHIQKNQLEEALRCFDSALKALEFHLGLYHPLHATLYSILGKFYVEKELYQDAYMLFKSSLVCTIRILGANHVQTGEIYQELAELLKKMGQKEEALQDYEKACLVFEAAKGAGSVECANLSFQISSLYLELGIDIILLTAL